MYVACEKVSESEYGLAYIPEYLYSFSLGSWDWRMYTIFAGVPTELFDA